jgi:hypothetical protein
MVHGVAARLVGLVAVVFLAAACGSAFAILQAISNILYRGMCLCMFASAIKLHRSQADVKRHPAVPAGLYAAILVVGVIVLALATQLLYHFRRPEWTSVEEPAITGVRGTRPCSASEKGPPHHDRSGHLHPHGRQEELGVLRGVPAPGL